MYGIIVSGAILIVLFVYLMHKETHHLTVTNYCIQSDKLPDAFQGSKIVVLADLHNNSFGQNNEQLVRRIDKEKPDYIMITGDMLVGRRKADYFTALDLLENLCKKYQIYYVNGNHEQRLSSKEETKDSVYREYHDILTAMGVHFVHNDTLELKRKDASILITGLEIDEEFYGKVNRPNMSVPYIEKCIGNCNRSKYNILLAHNPMYFDYYSKWGADLVLSGHVHGGIMRLPFLGGVISPQYILFPRYDSGRFEREESTMLLSRGLGVHTLKVRIFNRPELIVFSLMKH
jgi:predicted MPP superfamily phosphohydrolase